MGSVRMGEIAVSSKGQDELVARGLGSCIGLALVDRAAGVAGLAHIVLPQASAGEAREIGKYADSAVPEIVSRMLRAGAVEHRIEAVLAGGARMFEVGELDIGARNDAAVRAALTANRVKIRATATGGDRGRTIRVNPAAGAVTVKEAGGEIVTLLEGSPR
jgi:chemotaxis protein CheD